MLMKEYEEWRSEASRRAAGPMDGPGGPAWNPAAAAARRCSDASTTMPAHNGMGGGMGQGSFRKFLDQKFGETTDNETKGRLK